MTADFGLYGMRLGTLDIYGPDSFTPKCTLTQWSHQGGAVSLFPFFAK